MTSDARDTLDRLLRATEEILAELRYLRRRLPKPEPADDPFTLAEQLRLARTESGLTLRALEAEIGVPFNCLSRVERGVGLASPVNAQRIRNWLNGATREGAGDEARPANVDLMANLAASLRTAQLRRLDRTREASGVDGATS